MITTFHRFLTLSHACLLLPFAPAAIQVIEETTTDHLLAIAFRQESAFAAVILSFYIQPKSCLCAPEQLNCSPLTSSKLKLAEITPKPKRYPKSTNRRCALQAVLAIADLLGRNVWELFRISWRCRKLYNERTRNLSIGCHLKCAVLVWAFLQSQWRTS